MKKDLPLFKALATRWLQTLAARHFEAAMHSFAMHRFASEGRQMVSETHISEIHFKVTQNLRSRFRFQILGLGFRVGR